jgi:hypothetical protein
MSQLQKQIQQLCRIVFVMVSLISFWGCSKSENKQGTQKFVVVDSLIDSAIVIPQSQLTVSPPRGWYPASDSDQTELATAMTVISPESRRLTLIDLFADTLNAAGLLVCGIQGLRLDSDTASYFAELRETWHEQYGIDGVRSDQFWHDSIFVQRFTIASDVALQLQLFCFPKNQDAIELWYYMPKNKYPNLASKIESSIASLRPKQ